MTTPVIRLAAPADAARLSAFAAQMFRDTFGKDNKPSDLEMYLKDAFTVERQAAEISDPNATVLLVEDAGPEGVQLAGYAHVLQGEPPPAVTGPAPIELKRFYIARPWHGRGVAQMLMQRVLETAQARGARTLWLAVWEHNPRAIAFYGKFGFRRVGQQSFVLGTDVQTDWLLARDVDPDQSPSYASRSPG